VAIAKAKPGVLGATDYIGNADGPVKNSRPGMDEWISQAIKYANGSLWNNGSYGQRDMKGKPGTLSVHATGRAVDLSYRDMPDDRGKPNGRQLSKVFIEACVANANELGLQMVIDYWPQPFGRAWRCDRMAWQVYQKQTVSGAPGGDWWHVEITPKMADNPNFVKAAFLKVFEGIPA
jgi:hypothetical protein